MDEQLKLLFVHIPRNYLTEILRVFHKENIKADYLSLCDDQEAEAAIERATSWDLIILSNQQKPPAYQLLNRLSEKTKNTPLIFLSEHYSSSIAATAMQKGANDCISINGLERLIPVVERELQHRNIKNKYLELSKTQNILSKITDRSRENVFLFDGQTFQCLFSSSAPIFRSGYTEERILTLKPSEIYSEYNSNSFKALVTPLLEDNQEEISICTYVRGLDSVYPAETHFRKVKHNGSPYIIAINKDIRSARSNIQKLQRQRSLTQKYIRKSNHKEALIANAAHDMRTSLNAIILSTKLLKKKNNDQLTGNYQRLINAIYYSGKHLIQYIEEFFDSADNQNKTNQINIKTVSVDALGKELYYTFDPIATEKNITFTYQFEVPDQYTVSTNPTYLKRILKNILNNAFKYTHQGEVVLTIYRPPKEELQNININLDKAIAFQIQDTGIGIPESKLPHVFRRFVRINQKSSSKIDGSGLGLNISQKLTKILGGTLHIDSEVGTGSTITLFLSTDAESICKEPCQQYSSELPMEMKKSTKEKSILVIDDSKIHNLAIKEFLSYFFKNCITTRSVTNAYKILDQHSIDCIILDYIIFDTTCNEIIQNLKSHEKYANIPIIIYTGKKLTRREQEILPDHITAIIQKKTGSHNKLVNAIYACLDSEA